jgi:hypothetical protein
MLAGISQLIQRLLLPPAENEHQPSCFALEEEKGETWKGSGAMGPAINEARPSL